MRFAFFLSLVTVFSFHVSSKTDVQHEQDNLEYMQIKHVDNIITGKKISKEQLQKWHLEKKRYDDCGGCPLPQAYPGDQPVSVIQYQIQ